MAQSLDGRLATATGESQWISGEETLALAQELRRDTESILVGVGTVLADNPRLTCRLPFSTSPHRIILDSNLRTPLEAEVAATANIVSTTIYVLPGVAENRRDEFARLGVEIVEGLPDSAGRLEIRAVLSDLYRRGIRSTLVEGGGGVITSCLRENLVDRMVVVMAPMLIGTGVSSVGDLGIRSLSDAVRGHTVRVGQYGEDIVWNVEFACE